MSEFSRDITPIRIDLVHGTEKDKPSEKMSDIAQVIGPTVTELVQLDSEELASINPDGKTNWGCPAFRLAVRQLQAEKAFGEKSAF